MMTTKLLGDPRCGSPLVPYAGEAECDIGKPLATSRDCVSNPREATWRASRRLAVLQIVDLHDLRLAGVSTELLHDGH